MAFKHFRYRTYHNRIAFMISVLLMLALTSCVGPAEPLILQAQVDGSEQAVIDTNGEIDVTDVEVTRIEVDDTEVGENEIAVEELELDQMLTRATYLLGLDVQNSAGEELGEIEDLIIDLQTGQILYAILERGELLGMLDDERPVPLSTFEWTSELELMLATTQDVLNQVPEIDDDWPLTGDAGWDSEITEFWRQNGATIPVENEAIPARIRDLIGIHAGGLGDDLAIVEDFLIDLDAAKSEYVALFNANGFYEPNHVLIVPTSSAEIEVELIDGSPSYGLVMLAVNSQTLEEAPTMARDIFQSVDLVDSVLAEELNRYWKGENKNESS